MNNPQTKKLLGWKRKRYKIGVCNGCFDLLHSGHKYLIKKAKNKTDKLILLINSDSSIRKIKGNSRPYENLLTRTKKLNKLKAVDMVVSFDQTTPLRTIKMIKPDYLFKGSDYKKEKISGYNFLKKYGGKVIIIKRIKDYSSTSIINKKIK